jgi:hypothetical protein
MPGHGTEVSIVLPKGEGGDGVREREKGKAMSLTEEPAGDKG